MKAVVSSCLLILVANYLPAAEVDTGRITLRPAGEPVESAPELEVEAGFRRLLDSLPPAA